jgi:hypothetical protein
MSSKEPQSKHHRQATRLFQPTTPKQSLRDDKCEEMKPVDGSIQ